MEAKQEQILAPNWPKMDARISVVVCAPIALACNRVIFDGETSIACECNATHGDQLEFEWPADDLTYLRVTSNSAGARFERSLLLDQNNANQTENTRQPDYLVEVESQQYLQQVLGYGGAFTDSATRLISGLPDKVRERALNDYFGERGLDYNMARLPIAGTDMSTRPYSYDDLPIGHQDFELKHFRLQPEDFEHKIPTIKRANEIRRERHLEPLKIMAASWSAPAWMKSNQHLVQGRLIGNSSGAYYQAYARYLIKFMHEYKQYNISMWALTPQNEPHTPKRVGPMKINFNSVNFEPEEMADFLANNLVPSLMDANLTPDKLKLFIWDDTLDGLLKYQQAALGAKNVRDYTLGLALHWYSQGLREISYKHLYEARRRLPARYSMISTEASFIGRPKPGNWERGQRYARDLIENLRAGSVGWIDWNLALDMEGGPTWSRNFLDAAMLVDLERQVYYKNPMFYALGHVSRFIKPGSHVLPTELRPFRPELAPTKYPSDELVAVAAELEEPAWLDGVLRRRMALVALNRSNSSRRLEVKVRGCLAKKQPLRLEMSAKSVTSLAFLC